MVFPMLTEARRLDRLTPPSGKVRMVLDTDAYNEVDDQFAVAHALLSPDQMAVEALDAGVSVISIGVQTFTGDPGEKTFFECAALAGAKHISCHFQLESYPKAIAQVRAWSREYGIRVGIHCHGGYHFGGQPGVLKHLIGLGAPEIGLCIDTAWALQIGPRQGNPVKWTADFAGQIYGVHYKDFVFDPNGQWHDTVVGEGTLDLPAFVAGLEKAGFDGMAVIEYEADVENPVPALTRCVETMRALAG